MGRHKLVAEGGRCNLYVQVLKAKAGKPMGGGIVANNSPEDGEAVEKPRQKLGLTRREVVRRRLQGRRRPDMVITGGQKGQVGRALILGYWP